MENRKKLKHFHESGHLHEFTFSCYQQRQLLVDETRCEKLARSLDAAGKAEQIDLVAFVFMPEHIHLLTSPRTATPDLGKYLALIKQPFSKQIKELLIAKESELVRELSALERPGKTCFRFWQEGAGYDRNVFSPTAITHAIDYIHHNPVRRDLCKKAAEWKWSSASYYLDEPPRQQRPELPFIHGLPLDAV